MRPGLRGRVPRGLHQAPARRGRQGRKPIGISKRSSLGVRDYGEARYRGRDCVHRARRSGLSGSGEAWPGCLEHSGQSNPARPGRGAVNSAGRCRCLQGGDFSASGPRWLPTVRPSDGSGHRGGARPGRTCHAPSGAKPVHEWRRGWADATARSGGRWRAVRGRSEAARRLIAREVRAR
jgi:hypothetical protein